MAKGKGAQAQARVKVESSDSGSGSATGTDQAGTDGSTGAEDQQGAGDAGTDGNTGDASQAQEQKATEQADQQGAKADNVPVDPVLNAKAPQGDYTADTPTTGVVLQSVRQSSRAVQDAEARGEQVVTVTIPKDFTLMSDSGIPHEYKAGIDEMPVSHANHWWAKAQGVEIYQTPDRDTVR